MPLPTHVPNPAVDPDDLDNNTVDTPHLNDLLNARLHRRHVLKGGVGAIAVAGLGPLALAGCGGGGGGGAQAAQSLGFQAIAKSLADQVQIAAGYTATVIYATGDSIDPAVPDYAGNGSEANYARRSGDHHDGIHFFGLGANGSRQDSTTDRALLAVNHENIAGTVTFMHPNGQTNPAGVRPAAEALKEIEAHGVSVVEIRKDVAGRYAVQKASSFNRRITAATPISISGPVRGTKWVKTAYSPAGLLTRGTINNCGHGHTPWGTYLTAEENWAGYLRRDAGDDARRSQREVNALKRNGLTENRAGNNRWSFATPDVGMSPTEFSRWNMSVIEGEPADGTGDFRNVHNAFGYIVEIDPYDPTSVPKKRTAMGRRANEGCWNSIPRSGRPLAFYIGCDSRGEYVYKFVTTAVWNPADGTTGGLAIGDKYLDSGTIYAARFNADGTGTWARLDLSNPDVAAGVPVSAQNPGGYTFEDLADICVNTRLAAGAAGATRMDRPEWTAVNPFNGEIYITMTENPDRGNINAVSANNVPNPPLDAANPRYWRDLRTDNANVQRGNVHGHIVRIREDGDDAAATSFRWDIFLFGAQAQADAGVDDVNYQQNVNISGLSDFNDLSKPDGCWFSPTTGILWIETDDNTMTDRTNCMLLAAIPGRHGDGGAVSVVNKADGSPDAATRTAGLDTAITTRAGRKMTDATFKRFLVAPKGAEITGLTESPDGRALFINIQHPGENTLPADIGDPTKFESHWPGNGGGVTAYGPGGALARPRSATLVITRNDGGVIGT
jgi:secreted PhoX family phosphatase